MPLSTGDILRDRYRIDGLLAQGGMGAVYRGWDISLDVPVAVKENTVDSSEQARRQFQREARILARLHHPSLPRVTNHFVIDGQGQYLVMDLVEGESLADILTNLGQPMEGEKVLSWIKQVCDALDYLHSQEPPIIHRDIKPQNIIITAAGKAVLVDFGIAKHYNPEQATTTGARALTPGYAPVEQYGGRTNERTDIYSLGATLYTMLTNVRPPPDAIKRLTMPVDPLVPPSQLNGKINPETEKVILKSLEITTERRYPTVKSMITELSKAAEKTTGAGEPEETVKAERLPDPVQPERRSRRGLVIAGVALLLLIAAGIGWLLFGSGLPPTPNDADPPTAIEEAVIDIDGKAVDAEEGFQAVSCDTSPRIEIRFVDADGNVVEPSGFSYNWRFEPDDPNNEDKLNSASYATIYHVPCQLDNQTVTVEAQKDGKTFFTKSLLFEISQ